jgi:hypothetical protein
MVCSCSNNWACRVCGLLSSRAKRVISGHLYASPVVQKRLLRALFALAGVDARLFHTGDAGVLCFSSI